MANRRYFHEIAKGKFGRKIAYTNVDEITEENILSVLSKTIGIFNTNRIAVQYLWDYKNGDQPILYRTKVVRDDVINYVVENHAWEIVQFKNAQVNGEAIQFINRTKDEKTGEYVDKLNNYMHAAFKHVRDIASGEWQSAVGTSFKAAQFTKEGSDVPFRITVPTPLNTYIIYSESTGEPMLAVQRLKDDKDENFYLCYSETREFRVKNGSLLTVLDTNRNEVKSKLHAFGGIPIVEYPNTQDRMSDIELVITMLDAINNMQSNRMDAIEQFVQSWFKFVNCDIDEAKYAKMKKMGALVLKSAGSDMKPEADIITQELNQTQTQVAKEDLWNNVLSIEGIPNKQGNTGGDTQGAVELRNGWDFSKQRAKLKDPFIEEAEIRFASIVLNIIRIRKGDCPLNVFDIDAQINHSPTDNMLVKAQTYQILIQNGIHPLIAIKTCGLWGDAEKVFLLSKPYLDKLDKAISDIPNSQEQTQKAQKIVSELNS